MSTASVWGYSHTIQPEGTLRLWCLAHTHTYRHINTKSVRKSNDNVTKW